MGWSEDAKLIFGETLYDRTSHTSESHYLLNFTKMRNSISKTENIKNLFTFPELKLIFSSIELWKLS